MKKILKSLLQATLPAPAFAQLAAVSARRWSQKVERAKGLDKLNLTYIASYGRTVLQGPFRGMKYGSAADGRQVSARLVGCYEQELAAIVERCCLTPYNRIIDVGSAEGYYAVGFAFRIPEAKIVAFDTDPWARRACREIAAANHVSDRVQIKGYCSPERLKKNIGEEKCLILSDCEGYENVLLDPGLIPELARCDMIVEIHDAPPSLDHPLVARFQNSHRIELVQSKPRTGDEAENITGFSPIERRQLLDELRHPWQGWAVFLAK